LSRVRFDVVSDPAMTSGGENRVVVAIDGPAGAGKSTIARKLADTLGYVLLDTGAIYRSVALAAERAGVSWDDEARVTEVAADLARRGGLALQPVPRGTGDEASERGLRVVLEGEDVSAAIRTPSISLGASRISSIPAVRSALLELQRAIGANGGVVAEGRDIGTVVFPQAAVKVYLTASVAIRAERRHEELRRAGQEIDIEKVREEVELRDHRDTERAVAPLRQARDAVLVDSSGREIDELVEELAALVRRAAS